MFSLRTVSRVLSVLSTGLLLSIALGAQTSPSTPTAKPGSTTTAPAHRQVHRPAAPAAPALPENIPPVKGPVKTEFALRYQEITVGTGDAAQARQIYTVNYTGWLASDGTKFDSSYDRGKPIEFTQGIRRVIPGWDDGFAGMRVGGMRRLFIPYQLAYGDAGRGQIPPKSDLIFDIELVGVRDLNAPAPATPPEQATPRPATPQPPPGTPPPRTPPQ